LYGFIKPILYEQRGISRLFYIIDFVRVLIDFSFSIVIYTKGCSR